MRDIVVLDGLSQQVRTVPTAPAIAGTAVALPTRPLRIPADRLIYAAAVDRRWTLVTKDRRLRDHRHPRPVALW